MNSGITLAETSKPLAASGLWQMFKDGLQALRFRLGTAARAHARRRAFEAVSEDMLCDLGMAPDTATGHSSWQADLPFFMQSGFGRR